MRIPQGSAAVTPKNMDHLEQPIEKVAIIVAMQTEANPLIEKLGLQPNNSLGLFPALGLMSYSGKIKDKEIYLIVNGTDQTYHVDNVGTTPAALTAYEVIRVIKPDTIISAGTAGGFANKGANVGDVYISSTKFMYHDRRIPLGDFSSYGIGSFPCLEAPAMVASLGLKSGVISTGNSLTMSTTDQKVLMENNAVAKEMEVAAIAEVANKCGVNVMAVKGITNVVGVNADAPGQFEKNFNLATNNVARALPNVLEYIIGKTPQQLRTIISLVNVREISKGRCSSAPFFRHANTLSTEEMSYATGMPRAKL